MAFLFPILPAKQTAGQNRQTPKRWLLAFDTQHFQDLRRDGLVLNNALSYVLVFIINQYHQDFGCRVIVAGNQAVDLQ